jgi:uncharacterized membrane protein
MREEHKKPNEFHKEKYTIGQRVADKFTRTLGSWKFIIIQSLILIAWIILNVVAWINHWDPYPFILLNLALSFQAAYAAPIIMMSQNRAEERDRRKTQSDFETNRKAEKEIKEVKEHLRHIEESHLNPILKAIEEIHKKLEID